MSKFERKKNVRRLLYSTPFLLLLLIITIAFSRGVIHAYQKANEARAGLAEARHELKTEKERQQFLESELARLKSERGKEEEVRNKFRVAKEGENMVIIVDDSASTTGSGHNTNSWQRFLNLFQ